MHKVYSFLLVALCACSSAGNTSHETPIHDSIHDIVSEYKMLPIDESGSDSTLVSFINQIKGAVRTKDAPKLIAMLDSAAMASTGHEEHRIDKFIRYWKLESPEKTVFWPKIDKIVGLGGTWEEDEEGRYFSMPYTKSDQVLSQFDYQFDWDQTAICLFPKVKVHRIPREDSKVEAVLHYDIVNVAYTKNEFTKIQNIEGTIEGYVLSSNLMRLNAEHLKIRKVGEQWKIVAFIDAQ